MVQASPQGQHLQHRWHVTVLSYYLHTLICGLPDSDLFMAIHDFWTAKFRLFSAAALVLLGMAVSAWLSFHRLDHLTLSDYHQFSCNTQGAPGQELSLLLVTPSRADDIANQLCESPTVQSLYSRVTVSWKPRTRLTPADLISERYDVIWNRHHFLAGLTPDFDDRYTTLLHFDNYSVYWLSTVSEPVLTQEYFSGKRIGLLDDASSHTLNIIPLTSLGTLDGAYEVIYFDDPSDLYDSFYKGNIDLITGGFGYPVATPIYRTVINDSATAATFFIRKELEDLSLQCDLVSALNTLQSFWEGIRSNPSFKGDCP